MRRIPERSRRIAAGMIGLGMVMMGASPPDGPQAVSVSGRVVEKESGRGVAGAEIVVRRSVAGTGPIPSWVGDSTVRTDGEGRFAVVIPAEQAGEARLNLTLSRIVHPDFVPRKGFRVPMAGLLEAGKGEAGPSFEGITLERGVEFSGRVVTPEGKPAAGVSFWFENWAWGGNASRYYADANDGRADAEGRFRLRMPRTQSLALRVTPEGFAPFQRFWGTDNGSEHPEIWAPVDLGRIELEPGIVLSGRLLDRQGRPVAGRTLSAVGMANRFSRAATTDAGGRFAFAPLRQGNYAIYGEGQDMYGGIEQDRPPAPADLMVIRPVPVYLEAGVIPAPLEIREAETVAVPVRFVDSRGGPFRGAPAKLSGMLPVGRREVAPGAPIPAKSDLASSINEPEVPARENRIAWGAQMVSGLDGLASFRAPRGLENADLYTIEPDATFAFKTRMKPGEPLKYWGGGQLGILDADRPAIEVVVYRAPEVAITLATADGEPVPADAKPHVGFNVRGGDYGGNERKLADGRFRTERLMPDHEYEYSAWANGYVPAQLQRLSLPEGGAAELTLVLRKKPRSPVVGDPAPSFSVLTIDGRVLGPEEFRGRALLLHVWSPYWQWDRELPRLDAIRRRFGEDRLAMIGLALSVDVDAARKVIDGRKLAWPQAVLRDRGSDPMILDYDALWPPRSILIGPDGRILSRDLKGQELEDSIAKLLGLE